MPRILSKKTVSVALLLLATAAGASYWRKAIHPFESTDNTYLKAYISMVSAKQTGYVTEVHFHDNQKVQQGDLLVVIDDGDFRAKVAQAEAQVLVERARIQTLETDKRSQEAQIRQEQAGIAAAQADLEKTAKDAKRFGNLVAAGAVSSQARDSAVAAYKQAAAQHDKVRSARQQAESELASLAAQIGEARAKLQVAQAALDLARIDLAQTRIVAPMAGSIGNRSVQVGQLLKPGSVLAYLIPADGVFVEANFKETQIAQMRPGQAVKVHVDAYPDVAFEGTVDSFAPASGAEFSLLPPENATGNFTKIVRRVPVKIVFKPGSDVSLLKPGLSATAKVRVR